MSKADQLYKTLMHKTENDEISWRANGAELYYAISNEVLIEIDASELLLSGILAPLTFNQIKILYDAVRQNNTRAEARLLDKSIDLVLKRAE